MDEQLRDETVNDFCGIVARKYRYWCARHGEKETPEGLIRYAVEAGIIKDRTVAQYMVLEIYPTAMYNSKNTVEAFSVMIEKTGFCEMTIRRLLKRQIKFTPPAK